jgi:hypothetical protein
MLKRLLPFIAVGLALLGVATIVGVMATAQRRPRRLAGIDRLQTAFEEAAQAVQDAVETARDAALEDHRLGAEAEA